MTLTAYLIGHGHTRALARAQRKRLKAESTFGIELTTLVLTHEEFQPNFADKTDDDLQAILAPNFTGKLAAGMAGVEADLIITALLDRSYQRLMIATQSLGEIARARRQIARHVDRDVRQFLAAIRDISSLPICMLPPPPPIPDASYMRAYPKAIKAALKRNEIPPLDVRLACWSAYCDTLVELAGTLPDTSMIPLPEQVFHEGALARQFWAEDAVQANDVYGAVMLDEIESLYGRGRPEAEA